MPNDLLAPEEEGFFAWLSRPRRAVLNTLRGEYGMAAEQALDLVLNIPDALLPGDVIPEMSGPEADVEVGDLAGMDPGWKKSAVDVVGGAVIDPVTYLPAGYALSKAGQGIRGAAKATPLVNKALPFVDKAAKKVRNFTADTMNWHTLTPEQRAMETAAKAQGGMAQRASEVEAQRILKDLPAEEGAAVHDAIQNVLVEKKAGVASKLTTRISGVAQPLADNQLEAVDSLMLTPTFINATASRKAAMIKATKDSVALGQTQADEYLLTAGQRPPGGIGPRPFANAIYQGESTGPYGQRIYDMEDMARPQFKAGKGGTQSTQARAFETDDELVNALNTKPELMKAYQSDLSRSLMTRAEQQGRIATRKTLGDSLWKDVQAAIPNGGKAKGHASFDLLNKDHRDAVVSHLDDLIAQDGPARDFAVRAKTLFTGNLKMNPLNEALAKFNANVFKPAATVGVILPRISFPVRNSWSALAQGLSTPGMRGAIARDPRMVYNRFVGGLLEPLEEALTKFYKKPIRINNETNRALALADEAFAQAGGSVVKAKAYLTAHADPLAKDLIEALDQNVLANPIKLDEVMAQLNPNSGMWAKFKNNVYDLPSQLNAHVEDSMRLGFFFGAKRAGQKAPAAANSMRSALLDYTVPTVENRVMRTYLPFGAFMSQTMPQVGKLLMENVPEGIKRQGLTGGLASGLAGGLARNTATQMFETDPESPIYPDMQGKMAIPIGQTEKGDSRYLTSFGLPLEVVGDLPMGTDRREFERFIGVGANPLAKSAYAFLSGNDPFFGTPYGRFEKPYAAMKSMGMEEGPTAGFIRKAAGTGAIQPLTHLLGLAEPWLDDRQGPGLDTLRAATGIRARDVDEDMALRLNMEGALRSNPGVKQYTGFYKSSDDPDTMDLISDYNTAKKRVADKRKAAATVQ